MTVPKLLPLRNRLPPPVPGALAGLTPLTVGLSNEKVVDAVTVPAAAVSTTDSAAPVPGCVRQTTRMCDHVPPTAALLLQGTPPTVTVPVRPKSAPDSV